MIDPGSDYLARAVPGRWRVLGVDLLPMTIGHAHVLAAHTSWRPCSDAAVTDAVFATGLWVCSRGWRDAQDGIPGKAGRFSTSIGLLARFARATRADMQEKREVFAEYMHANASCPPTLSPPTDKPVSGRSSGAPLLARLVLWACDRYGLLPHEAFDLPIGQTLWAWITHLEQTGALRVPNAKEIEFEEFRVEQEKAFEKSGLTFEEFVKQQASNA